MNRTAGLSLAACALGALAAGDPARASAATFQRILALPNQEPDFLDGLFKAWSWMGLAQISAPRDPATARSYLRRLLDSRMGGEMREEAQRLLEALDEAGGPQAPGRRQEPWLRHR